MSPCASSLQTGRSSILVRAVKRSKMTTSTDIPTSKNAKSILPVRDSKVGMPMCPTMTDCVVTIVRELHFSTTGVTLIGNKNEKGYQQVAFRLEAVKDVALYDAPGEGLSCMPRFTAACCS